MAVKKPTKKSCEEECEEECEEVTPISAAYAVWP